MSRKPKSQRRGRGVKWRPIRTGRGVFVPTGPPVLWTPEGERELTAEEAARRFPGIDFGFPLDRRRGRPRKKK